MPALIDEKKPGIRLVKQNTNTFTEKGNHFFVHKLTYHVVGGNNSHIGSTLCNLEVELK